MNGKHSDALQAPTEDRKTLRVLSLGAGVQSSCLALMYARGELAPMPDVAIFADTHNEPKAVYAWLNWLETQLPYPVHRVSRGDLWRSATRVRRTQDGKRTYIVTGIPAYTMDGEHAGIGMRQCTRDFKIVPITSKVRQLLGRRRVTKKDGVLAEMIIGISFDELERMKPNQKPWIRSSWPLVDAGMTRADCHAWMEARGYPEAPRSACIFCPYRSDAHWMTLPHDEFAEACRKEGELQAAYAEASAMRSVPYLHEDRKPLATVKLNPMRRRSQRAQQRSLFINDCQGMCGV